MKHKTRKHAKPTILFGIIHAHWCGACKSTMPHWETMKKMLKSYSKIKCVEIEETQMATRLPSLNRQFVGENSTPVSADGYPTIFRIEDGKVEYYNGERTAAKMFNFATKHGKHGGEGAEGAGTVPPAAYGQQNTPLTMGGKSRRHRRHRRTQRAKSSWLALW